MAIPIALGIGAAAAAGIAVGAAADHVPGFIKGIGGFVGKIPVVGNALKGAGAVISYPLKPLKQAIGGLGKTAEKIPVVGPVLKKTGSLAKKSLSALGKIAFGVGKVGLGIGLVALAPSIALKAAGVGLITNGVWPLAKKIPGLDIVDNKIHTWMNGFSTMRTSSKWERIISDLRKAIVKMIEKLVDTLGKETEKNGKAVKGGKEAKEVTGYASPEKSSVTKEGVSKAAGEKGKDVSKAVQKPVPSAQKGIPAAGKPAPVVNLSEKIASAKSIPGPVAGPALDAGVKSVGKAAGRN